jgi:HSP20 family protein
MNLIPWKSKNRNDAGGEQPVPGTFGGFRTELDRLFDSFFHGALKWEDRPFGLASTWGPPLDVEETDKELLVRAEIPGISADDLQLTISGQALVISGEKKETVTQRPQGGYVYQERRYGSFRREVPLPSAVDPNDVQAEYKDGVLHVRLKKSQEALPKKIPVKTG